MRYPLLLSLTGLSALSTSVFAHGNHAAYATDHLLHLLAHHWPLFVLASVIALIPSLLRRSGLLRRRGEPLLFHRGRSR